MRPMMQDHEIAALEAELLNLRKSELNILEWGSGGSTVHFTRFLKAHGIRYRWLSIEHDIQWEQKVREFLAGDTSVDIRCIPAGATPETCRTVPMNEYVDYPATLMQSFDVILVDGRKRRRCLLAARRLVSSDGVVFLHDAQRSYYHSAFKVYPEREFLARGLWRGTPRPVGIYTRIAQALNYFYYRVLSKHVEKFKKSK